MLTKDEIRTKLMEIFCLVMCLSSDEANAESSFLDLEMGPDDRQDFMWEIEIGFNIVFSSDLDEVIFFKCDTVDEVVEFLINHKGVLGGSST